MLSLPFHIINNMGYESLAHEAEGRMGYWLKVKSYYVGQKILRLNIFR